MLCIYEEGFAIPGKTHLVSFPCSPKDRHGKNFLVFMSSLICLHVWEMCAMFPSLMGCLECGHKRGIVRRVVIFLLPNLHVFSAN